MSIVRSVWLFSWLFWGAGVLASPNLLTYQGRILKSDGTPLQYSSVSFVFQILDPGGHCVIYQEQANGVNMVNSGGVFDVPIGSGTIQWPSNGTTKVLDIFSNSKSYSCGSCADSGGTYNCSSSGGVYNSTGGAERILRVSFYDGSGWKTISPDSVIRSVPYAGYSVSSQKLGDHDSAEFVLKSEVNKIAGVSASCNAGSFLTWDAASQTFGCSGVSGASGGTITNIATGTGLSGGPITATGTISLANTTVSAGSYGSSSQISTFTVDAQGRLTSASNTAISISTANLTDAGSLIKASQMPANCSAGQTLVFSSPTGTWTCSSISITESQIAGGISASKISGNISGAAGLNVLKTGDSMSGSLIFDPGKGVEFTDSTAKTATLVAPSTINTSYTLKLPAGLAAVSGQVLSSDTSGNTSWITPSTTATAYSGTLPVVNGGTNSSTALSNNRVMVSSGGAIVEAGALSNGQILIGSTGAAPVAAALTAGSGITITPGAGSITIASSGSAPSGAAGGDLSGNYPNPSVAKIQGTAVSATVPSSNGQVLRYSTVTGWTPAFVSMFDLRSTITGTQAFGGVGCTAGQTLTWTAATDNLSCTNIAITSSQVSGLAASATIDTTNANNITSGTLNVARLPSSSGNSLNLGSQTNAIALPSGTTAQQPASPAGGWIRYNADTMMVEFYNGSIWSPVGNAVAPAGMIGGFPMASCPAGWLEANGATVSRTTYASLFAVIGTMYGAGDGSTTFALPDYRGYFLRGWNHGSGNDPDAAARTNRGDGTGGDAVGSKQGDQMQGHIHRQTSDSLILTTGGSGRAADGSGNVPTGNYTLGPSSDGVNGTPRVGLETRPKNTNVIYCVSTATTSTITVASSGSGTTNYIPQWTSATGLGNSPVAVSGGNVGVGIATPASKLDVAGEIKLGNTSSTCNASTEGQQRYNSTTHAMEFCNGTSWTAMSGGSGVPAGTVEAMLTATCPTGYIAANGAAISRTTYSALFAAISTMYGTGDGSTTFNVPDLRGYFLRGWNNGAGNDPDAASRTNRGDGTTGDAVGTKQVDGFKSHNHNSVAAGNLNNRVGITGGPNNAWFADGGDGGYTTSYTGGNETRPKNINVLYCIKY